MGLPGIAELYGAGGLSNFPQLIGVGEDQSGALVESRATRKSDGESVLTECEPCAAPYFLQQPLFGCDMGIPDLFFRDAHRVSQHRGVVAPARDVPVVQGPEAVACPGH